MLRTPQPPPVTASAASPSLNGTLVVQPVLSGDHSSVVRTTRSPPRSVTSAGSGASTFQKTFTSRRNNLKIGQADLFAFSSFLSQSAVFGNGARPHPSAPHSARGEAKVTAAEGPRPPATARTRSPPKRKLGILTDSLTPQAMAFVKNHLLPEAVQEANAAAKLRSQDPPPRDWRRHSLQARSELSSSAHGSGSPRNVAPPPPSLRPHDIDLTFFAKNEDGQCRGREYVSVHPPNARGIQKAVETLAVMGGGGESGTIGHHHHHSAARAIRAPRRALHRGDKGLAGSGGVPQALEAPRSPRLGDGGFDSGAVDDDESVYYTSTSSDEDRGEFAAKRKEKAAAKRKQVQRALANIASHGSGGVGGNLSSPLLMPAGGGAGGGAGLLHGSAAALSGVTMRTVPTGCGNCDFVAASLDRFDARVASGKLGHISRLTRPHLASQHGGDAAAAQRETARMSMLAGQSFSASAVASSSSSPGGSVGGLSALSPLHMCATYQNFNRFVLNLTPRCMLALRRAVLRHFTDELVADAAVVHEPHELTLHEFLSCLLHIPKSAVSRTVHVSLATPIEVSSCVAFETIESRFHLRHRSLYAPQHTSQLATAPTLGKHFAAVVAAAASAAGAALPIKQQASSSPLGQGDSLAFSSPQRKASSASDASPLVNTAAATKVRPNPLKVDPAVVQQVQMWERLFEIYDVAHAGVVNRHLFLLNILVATSDVESATKVDLPFGDDPWESADEVDDAATAIAWKPEDARGIRRLPERNNRVRFSVAWIVALLRQRPEGEVVRPGELFCLRDMLTAEVRHHYTQKALEARANAAASAKSRSGGAATTSRANTPRQGIESASSTMRRENVVGALSPAVVRTMSSTLIRIDQAISRSAGLAAATPAATVAAPSASPSRPLSPFAPQVHYIEALERFAAAAQHMIETGELTTGGDLSAVLVEAFAIVA